MKMEAKMTVSQALNTRQRSCTLFHLILGSLAFVAAASVHADNIIYNNLGAASANVDQILASGFQFDSFTAAANETLSSVQLALESFPTTGATGTLNVGLYSLSNIGTPTLLSSLGTINNSAISTGVINDYTVAMTTDPNLVAGTRYWIGVSDFADSFVSWSFTSSTAGTGVAGEFWADNDGAIMSPNTIRGPFQMELTVPDETQPASMLTLGLAGVAFVAWKTADRRRLVTVAANRRQAL
jgi:hypothetical protein